MRKVIVLIAASLIVSGPLRGDEGSLAVVEKAIKAHGGEEKLAKLKAANLTAKGSLDIMGQTFEFSQESWVMAPDKFKEKSELDIGGQKITVVTVMNGDKITLNANGMDVDLPDVMKDDLKDAVWLLRFGTIAGLKSKELQLSPLGESQVNNKPAIGVKVSAKGHKDVNLFFDKESGLLAKSERRALDFNTQQEMKEERFVSEYQEVQGIKVPKKLLVHRDGQKFLEAEVTSAKYLEKLDDNIFQP